MTKEDDDTVETELIARVRGGDRAARVVYADWLEERGRIDCAMLLRGGGTLSAVTDLLCWLHTIGDLGDLKVFEVAPGCAMFGLDSRISIPPQSGATITTAPQAYPVRPTLLVVPESIADRFSILDIRIGHRSQLETADPIPASLLTPSSIAGHGGRISFDVVHAAQNFTIEIENTSDRECSFFALVFCREAHGRANDSIENVGRFSP